MPGSSGRKRVVGHGISPVGRGSGLQGFSGPSRGGSVIKTGSGLKQAGFGATEGVIRTGPGLRQGGVGAIGGPLRKPVGKMKPPKGFGRY